MNILQRVPKINCHNIVHKTKLHFLDFIYTCQRNIANMLFLGFPDYLNISKELMNA